MRAHASPLNFSRRRDIRPSSVGFAAAQARTTSFVALKRAHFFICQAPSGRTDGDIADDPTSTEWDFRFPVAATPGRGGEVAFIRH